jgi:predicted AlkP superfamily phosphohydrolase/phosphomutase
MLSNSLVAAALATAYVVILVLQLNPRVSSGEVGLVALARTVGPFYAAHLTVLCYAVLVVGQLFARDPLSPAWTSVGVLTWLGAVAAGAGAALMWANRWAFDQVITPDTTEAMTEGAAVLAGAAILFAAIGIVRRRVDRRWRPLCAAAWALVAMASLALPVLARGGARPPVDPPAPGRPIEPPATPRSARVTLLALDAGSLDFLSRVTAEGRLPNFGRILDAGAVMHLATLRPASAEAIWTAVATGKLPQRNGVRSAAVYRPLAGGEDLRLLPDYCFASGLLRFGFLTAVPQDASAVRARTLWALLSALGVSVGVVNWPLTAPTEPVVGYLVSDQYARSVLTGSGAQQGLVSPPDLHAALAPTLQAAREGTPLPDDAMTVLPERFHAAARIDGTHDAIARFLSERFDTQVTIARYEGLDPIGHYFLRYAEPLAFGEVTDEEHRRYGAILEGHYALIDHAIGRLTADLGPDDLLLVVSGYGMEPLGLGKRLLERVIGDPRMNGTHEAAPDGFLVAYGGPVARARHVTRASVADVVPTVLYALGLPVGRDMDGYALTALFRTSFTDDTPITFIPTYDR